MEIKKVVCYYCGTAYDARREKCPLCGSTERTEEELPVQRRRITEEERRERQHSAKGKYAVPKKIKAREQDERSPKRLLTAAFVFLLLAVLTVFYFIGDMIGWWPGLEDMVKRNNPYTAANTKTVDTSCKQLLVEPEEIVLAEPGKRATMTVSVNLDCDKTVYCVSENEKVALISQSAQTKTGAELKSATFTITAAGIGETQLKITCGEESAFCKVICGNPDETAEPDSSETESVPLNYEPELNYEHDASLFGRGETLQLRVTNLPEGSSATWRTEDATVAKIDQNGVVTAIGGGKTKVTASVGGRKTELIIRCTFGEFADIGAHLEKTDVTVRRNETFDLYLYDSEGEHISGATYAVSKPEVCKVTDGVVQPLSGGTADVTVIYNGQEYTCIVRVR